MKKVLFSFIAVAFFFASCSTSVSPTLFNEAIVGAYGTVADIKNSYDNTLTEAVKADNYASITAATDSALAKIDAEITKVKDLGVPKGGDAYKEATVKVLESTRAIVEVGKKYASLTTESTEAEFDALEKEYNDKEDVYSKYYDEMSKAQEDYAKSIGYEVR